MSNQQQDSQHELDQLSINALRFLAVDAVEKANSGHPGAPLGCAPIAYLLYHKLMKHDPSDPKWIDRDRFVLSNGHASVLLYGALHLSGYDLPMSQLEQFRQWGSHTPGHPEYGEAPGVEVTTGPLGQGFAMAVGIATAEKHLAAIYNRDTYNVVDHHTYVLCGDGDLMEGISHETASLAGTLGLGKLIVLYDDNLISLDGPTELSFTEDVTKRFEAYHWHVPVRRRRQRPRRIEDAIQAAKAETTQPSLIRVRTVIGYGSPKAGTNKVHGEALGAEAAKATKKNLGWPEDKTFYVPEEARKNWDTIKPRGKKPHAEWDAKFEEYKQGLSRTRRRVRPRHQAPSCADGWEKKIPTFPADKPVATRNAGQIVMNAIDEGRAGALRRRSRPHRSTKTIFKDSPSFHVDPTGRNVFFGVREFGMMADGQRHGRARRPHPVRLDLLHLLRLLPQRDAPGRADGRPLALHLHPRLRRPRRRRPHPPAHRAADEPARHPAAHRLPPRRRQRDRRLLAARARAQIRQLHGSLASGPPCPRRDKYKVHEGARQGAYVLDAYGKDIILVATGSEVSVILKAAEELKAAGINATVVSMPSFKIFDEQDRGLQGPALPRRHSQDLASKPAPPWAGTSTSATTAPSSASTASAPPHPAPSRWRSSASA